MYIFILVIHIIVSLVLVAVILLQAGKGGGLAETFGGGGGTQTTIFGVKASAFLTRATSVSAVLFLCTSLLLTLVSSVKQKSLMEGVKIKQPQKIETLPKPVSQDTATVTGKSADTNEKKLDSNPKAAEEVNKEVKNESATKSENAVLPAQETTPSAK